MPTTKKPKGFPLYPHAVGQWAKTINYTTYYFGPWADPDGALEKYNREVINIRAGKPRNTDTAARASVQSQGTTLCGLVNQVLTVKRQRVASGELAARSHTAYERTAVDMARFFGEHCVITALSANDFKRYREPLGKRLEASQEAQTVS